jgi:hypothetical protein
METSSMALVRGWSDTRVTLHAWNERPWPILRRWTIASAVVGVALLLAVWVVASLSIPDPSPIKSVKVTGSMNDVARILYHNGLVLALHAFACVAGFIAGSSLPQQAENHSGLWRRVHERAGPLAIAFVVGATAFSLTTQAYVLGFDTSTVANHLHMAPALLLLALTPHALPELIALFLPLAAWILASRRGDWHELLAATFVTVAIAVPVLVLAALVEVYVSPHIVTALTG